MGMEIEIQITALKTWTIALQAILNRMVLLFIHINGLQDIGDISNKDSSTTDRF